MTAETAGARAAQPTWRTVAIAAVFGLFYAYLVWSAVDLLVRQATGPLGLNGWGWFVHILPIVFPMLAFAVAFVVGWRRRAWEFALTLLTGLAVAAAFWVNILAYAVTSFALYGG
jgi:hypothetical protein